MRVRTALASLAVGGLLLAGCAASPEAELNQALTTVTERANDRDADGLRDAADELARVVSRQSGNGLTAGRVKTLLALVAKVKADADLIEEEEVEPTPAPTTRTPTPVATTTAPEPEPTTEEPEPEPTTEEPEPEPTTTTPEPEPTTTTPDPDPTTTAPPPTTTRPPTSTRTTTSSTGGDSTGVDREDQAVGATGPATRTAGARTSPSSRSSSSAPLR